MYTILNDNVKKLNLPGPYKQWFSRYFPVWATMPQLCEATLPDDIPDLRIALCHAMMPLAREELLGRLKQEMTNISASIGNSSQSSSSSSAGERACSKRVVAQTELESVKQEEEWQWRMVAMEHLAQAAGLMRQHPQASTPVFMVIVALVIEAGACTHLAGEQPVQTARNAGYIKLDLLARQLFYKYLVEAEETEPEPEEIKQYH